MDGLKFENLLRRLGSIPGLAFLQKWVFEYNQMTTRFAQRKGDLENYAHIVTGAASEMKDASGQSRAALDPDYDESGKYVGDGYDDEDYGHVPRRESTNAGPTDALTHNYEDVFYDDED